MMAKRSRQAAKRTNTTEPMHLLSLAIELQKTILVRCCAKSLQMLEQSCRAFAPPAPRLSVVQEAVKESMQQRFRGAHLGLASWPSLLRKHERSAEVADLWEADTCNFAPEEGYVLDRECGDLARKIMRGFQGGQPRMSVAQDVSRAVVSKLRWSISTGNTHCAKVASSWVAGFCKESVNIPGFVAAGAPEALVGVLEKENASVPVEQMVSVISQSF